MINVIKTHTFWGRGGGWGRNVALFQYVCLKFTRSYIQSVAPQISNNKENNNKKPYFLMIKVLKISFLKTLKTTAVLFKYIFTVSSQKKKKKATPL